MPSGNGYLLHSQGLEDDGSSSLYLNPFAGHTETTFTSALRPKETRVVTRPVLRRRASDGIGRRARNDHDPWHDEDASEGTHIRSRTLESSLSSSNRTSHHPLVRNPRGMRSSGSIASLNDTRPRLKRLLGDLGLSSPSHIEDDSKNSDSEQSPVGEPASQTVVIVHEVRVITTKSCAQVDHLING